MRVQLPGLKLCPESVKRDAKSRMPCEIRRVQIERGRLDLAAEIGAVGGEQPGFRGDEGDRMAGADGRTPSRSRIGIEPARAVECQQRIAVTARQRVGLLDQAGLKTADLALETNAEESIDDQRPALPVGDARANLAPAGREALKCIGSIGWQRGDVSAEYHAGIEKTLSQQASKASPPLLPGPARTSIGAFRSVQMVVASSAAARPARCIRGRPEAAASIRRMSSVR